MCLQTDVTEKAATITLWNFWTGSRHTKSSSAKVLDNNIWTFHSKKCVNFKFKIGCSIMLVRNLRPQHGLCNGIRLVVRRCHNWILGCEKPDGSQVLIPRISLTPNDSALSMEFTRRQFPIRICFGIATNKSQGQNVITCYCVFGRATFLFARTNFI